MGLVQFEDDANPQALLVTDVHKNLDKISKSLGVICAWTLAVDPQPAPATAKEEPACVCAKKSSKPLSLDDVRASAEAPATAKEEPASVCAKKSSKPLSLDDVRASAEAAPATAKEEPASVCAKKSSKPLSLDDVRASAEAGDQRAQKALDAIARLAPEKRATATWAMVHRMATQQGKDQYFDPASGYTVFTAGCLKKQKCCGYSCRHCPHERPESPQSKAAQLANDW
mmetsp:Transcript_168834/g.542628  ORF Transcript_168834/g.542628 Transcript_168834/m.542628 type:complete len:228 (-) Transcript_168834:366-1049(-)